MATHECVSEVAWHTEANHIHTTQSQHCTESLLWEQASCRTFQVPQGRRAPTQALAILRAQR